jgi:hypothetical protein
MLVSGMLMKDKISSKNNTLVEARTFEENPDYGKIGPDPLLWNNTS